MKKLLTLLGILIVILGLFGGYLFLTETIVSGDVKIADGQKQLKEGEDLLKKGKARLAEGKKKLAMLNNIRNGVSIIPFMGVANRMPVSGDLLAIANNKIDEGNQMVARGEEKIKSGEAQLAEGKLQLSNGAAKLDLANKIRTACGIGTLLFTILLLILIYRWRIELISSLKRIIHR